MGDKGYAYTDSLRGTIPKLTSEQLDQVHREIDFHIEQYKRLEKKYDGATIANNYLRNMSEVIETNKKTNKISESITCKKGCAFCCKMDVHITNDEAELLAAITKDENIEIDQQKLDTQSSWSEEEWKTKTAEEKSCVFLDENDSCRVYEYRPMNCRKLTVISDPMLCDTIKFKDGTVHRFIDIQAEIMSTAIMTYVDGGSLPKTLKLKLISNGHLPLNTDR